MRPNPPPCAVFFTASADALSACPLVCPEALPEEHRRQQDARQKKKSLRGVTRNDLGKWCRRRDSNPHSLATTSPSSWRVYQFHHHGMKEAYIPPCWSMQVFFGEETRKVFVTCLFSLFAQAGAASFSLGAGARNAARSSCRGALPGFCH